MVRFSLPRYWAAFPALALAQALLPATAARADIIPGPDKTCMLASCPISVVRFGADPTRTADSTTQLQAALNFSAATGVPVTLGSFLNSFKITQALTVASNAKLLGPGRIYMPAANFNCTSPVSCRYASNAVGISVSGLKTTPYTPNSHITIDGITLQSEVSDGRAVDGIACQNDTDLVIQNVEMFGFPLAHGIRCASLNRALIQHNYIHDFTDNSTGWSGGDDPQITGIEIDNDRVNGILSSDFSILNNTIENITVGSAFNTAYGYQADGINTVGGAHRCELRGNNVKNTGEGFDLTNTNSCRVTDNYVENTYYYAYKLIHGSSYNVVSGNNGFNCGISCMVIAGGQVTPGASFNTITGNNFNGLDQNGTFSGSDTAVISIVDNTAVSPYIPNNNFISGNTLIPGANGKYAYLHTSLGTNNTATNNREYTGLTGHALISPATAGTSYQSAFGETARIGLTGAQSVTATTTVKVALDTVATGTDPRGQWDNTNHRWVAQLPCTVTVSGQVRYPSVNTGKTMEALIEVNGGTVAINSQAYGSVTDHPAVTAILKLSPGDYVELWTTNGDTGTVSLTNNPVLTYMNIAVN